MIDPALALRLVREEQVIAYDTETSGLGSDAFVVGYVVTSFDHSIYVPVRHEGGGNIPAVEEFETELARAFEERGRRGFRTVGHNLAYDLKMSHRQGIRIYSPVEDTSINEALVHPIVAELGYGFGLDDCCERNQVQAKKGAELYAAIAQQFGGMPDRKQMGNFWRMPGDHPLVVDYATGDGVSTLQLWSKQQILLDEELIGGNLRRVWKLECDLIPYVHKMHIKGMKIDMDYAQRVDAQLKSKIDDLMTPFPHGFNVRAPSELERLFRDNGFTDFALTATGKPSFKEDWLETNEIGRSVLAVRRLLKAQDSFIKPLVETFNVKGRVHAILNQSRGETSGAGGGRFSCVDPNLQAFPKRNKEVGQIVRPLVIPDDGMTLVEADFSQQEPRLFGHYSEDENLCRGYLSTPPLDIHDTAAQITGLQRDMAKRLGMGILTMMGVNTLAANMSKYNWTVDDAKRGKNQYLGAFPGIRQFQKDAEATMRDRGYVRTLLGRKAEIEDPKFAYKAVSRIIQGSGADHMKSALLRGHQFCEAYDDEIQILMTIHDSNIFQYTRPELKTELVRIIEDTAPALGLILPIPVEVGEGKNWAEASYGEKK